MSLVNGAVDGLQDSLEAAKRELASLKAKVDKADDVKAGLFLEKMEAEQRKTKAKQEMLSHADKQQSYLKELNQSLTLVQDEITTCSKGKQGLMDKLRRCQQELDDRRAEAVTLKQKFKISAQIPDTEVKFLHPHEEEEVGAGSGQLIRGVFTISQRAVLLLKGGQALVSFEEEKVACQILKNSKCVVSCEDTSVEVKPRPITLDPAVKFEVHLDVSREELNVSDIPASMSKERTRDRLELSFSKPSRGGGEVEVVEYDEDSGTGKITFLHPGVAERLALIGRYNVHLKNNTDVKVGPSFEYKLQKFQTFCCSTKRTVLLDDIKDVEDEEDLQDHLEIHFQKPSNSGGEIESIRYASGGKRLQALFGEDPARL
ncbi:N-myc-interactor [Cololabis saira]|uniref:N-myc-interactor n=1 Tax=Cololabis saira TaxID=129043 RepID=UPI002AD44F17|nr:N-myc-interactor [Cololabis saira]